MNSKLFLNLTLPISFLLVSIILLAGVWNQQNKEKQLRVREVASTVSQIKIPEKINSLQIKRLSEEFHLRRENSWLITSPYIIRANPKSVHAFVDRISELKVIQQFPQTQDNLQAFGLENPSEEIQINSDLNIKVGLYNAINGTTYISIGEHSPIYQVSSAKSSFHQFEINSLIDKKVFKNQVKEISRIEILKGDQLIHSIEKISNGHWKNSQQKKVNEAKLIQLVETMFETETEMILKGKISQKIIDPNKIALTLKVFKKNEQPSIYRILEASQEGSKSVKLDLTHKLIISPEGKSPLIVSQDFLDVINDLKAI